MAITADRPVGEIMNRWPPTIRVFLGHRFHCVGCPIAEIHTVADACRAHHSDLGAFLDALNVAASTGGSDIRRS